MTKERKALIKKLDTLCRKILLKRDLRYGDCFNCISCKRLYPINVAQVGHYISRRHYAVRWDLRNINLQCSHCNYRLSGNPIEYEKTLLEMYGKAEVDWLKTFYRESPGYSVFDLQQLVKEYQGILLKYEQEENQ